MNIKYKVNQKIKYQMSKIEKKRKNWKLIN